jgi:uncharacterized protein (DUF736 family)
LTVGSAIDGYVALRDARRSSRAGRELYSDAYYTLTKFVRMDPLANIALVTEANERTDQAPDYRVFVGRAEIGAAWNKTSAEQRDYLSLKLDDPSFTGPIFANLFDDDGEDTHRLIWSRPRRASND